MSEIASVKRLTLKAANIDSEPPTEVISISGRDIILTREAGRHTQAARARDSDGLLSILKGEADLLDS
jgi:hypothetical protein